MADDEDSSQQTRVTYAADVGAVAKGAFAWARVATGMTPVVRAGVTAMDELADALAQDVGSGTRVSLGWESPLFVPVRTEPARLTKARGAFEQRRAFTAAGGTGSLVTGLVELAHLARRVPARFHTATLHGDADGVAVWEAFVSGTQEPRPPCSPDVDHEVHGCDALTAAAAGHAALTGTPSSRWTQLRTRRDMNWGPDASVLDLVATATGDVALRDPHRDEWDMLIVQTSKPVHDA